MCDKFLIKCVSRRDLFYGAGCAAAGLAVPQFLQSALAGKVNADNGWSLAVKLLTDGAPLATGKISVSFPKTAVHGALVPFSLAVDSPMTSSDYVKVVHLISTANPSADLMSFFFTPIVGRAEASSRLRLAKTQKILAIAQMSDGAYYVAEREVEVFTSACFC